MNYISWNFLMFLTLLLCSADTITATQLDVHKGAESPLKAIFSFNSFSYLQSGEKGKHFLLPLWAEI